jgi:predicted DNA-binding transcriptional regulator YafY
MSEQTKRLGCIVRLIASRPGITFTQLRDALEQEGIKVSERTVAKDVLCLKHDYHLLPEMDRLRSGYVLRDMATLSDREVQLVMDLLNAFGVRFGDDEAIAVMTRLSGQLNARGAKATRGRTRTIRQQDIYPKANSRVQSTLLDAMRNHQAIEFVYATPRIGKPVKLRGYPIVIVFHERGWYCIVKDLVEKTLHPRRFDRIRSASLLKNAPVNNSHDNDVTQAEFLMSCGWGMSFPASAAELKGAEGAPPIVVRFDRTVAPYILESYKRHPRGTVSAAKDGTGDALLKIHLASPQEFLYWVRSFGSRAWVVSPQSVVEQERAEIRRMHQRYSSST